MKRMIAVLAAVMFCSSSAIAQTKATLMFGGKSIVWGPAFVALDKGFFAQEGIEPELTYASQGVASVIAAELSGQVLMGFLGGPDAMNALNSGAPFRIVFSSGNQLTLEFTASNKLLEKTGVTAASPLKQKIALLKGANVGIWTPGDTQSQVVNFLAKKYGLDPASVNLVMTQNTQNEMAAFQKGAIDVMLLSPPVGSQAESLGLGKIFMTVREVPELQGYPYLVGTASLNQLRDKPALVKAVIKAMARGTQLLRKDPEGAKASVRKAFPDLAQKAFDDSYKAMLTVLPASPVPTREGFATFQALAREAPTRQPETSYEAAVDPRIAAQVAKEIGQ